MDKQFWLGVSCTVIVIAAMYWIKEAAEFVVAVEQCAAQAQKKEV